MCQYGANNDNDGNIVSILFEHMQIKTIYNI